MELLRALRVGDGARSTAQTCQTVVPPRQGLKSSPLAPPPPKSPDLFGPDPTDEELDLIEETLTSCCGQHSEKTLETDVTNFSDNISTEDDVVADSRDSN